MYVRSQRFFDWLLVSAITAIIRPIMYKNLNKKNTVLGFQCGVVCNLMIFIFSFTPSYRPDSAHLQPNSSRLFKIITSFDATQVTEFTKTGNVRTRLHVTRSRNYRGHEHETICSFFIVVGVYMACQQYKNVKCCQGNATIRSLCTAVELQNIVYCCQQ